MNAGRSTMEPEGAGRHGRESPRGLASREGEPINDGLIAESRGNFDTAEYERQLKHGVDG